MAHYTASVDTPRPLHEVFAYLSDFSTTREWDPGVVEAERLNGQAVGRGLSSGSWRSSPVARMSSPIGSSSTTHRMSWRRRRERHRRLSRPAHVRDKRRRYAGHLRRRSCPEGRAANRRPALGPRVQPRRRPRARRSPAKARPLAAGDAESPDRARSGRHGVRAPQRSRPAAQHRRRRLPARAAGPGRSVAAVADRARAAGLSRRVEVPVLSSLTARRGGSSPGA